MGNTTHTTKHQRMEARMGELRAAAGVASHSGARAVNPAREYLRGYVECFNSGEYYEAHDVLEHHWLQLPRDVPEWTCFKGLIQFAGGFVHLRLHYFEPGHRVHGKRLRPAVKLFELAEANLLAAPEVVGANHMDLAEILAQMRRFRPENGVNTWTPDARPRICIERA